MQHTLGLAGGTGGVEDEQGILRIHRFRRAVTVCAVDDVVVPDIATFLPVDAVAGALDHQAGVYIGAGCQCRIRIDLEWDILATAHSLICGDQCLAIRVQDAVLQRFRRKSAEDDRVNCSDAGARQHGISGLGDHRHVDADAVAFFYTAGFQRIGQFAYVFLQLAVGDVLAVRGVVPLPDQCGLPGALRQVAVYAVVADIQFAAGKPGGLALDEVIFDYLVPGLVPGQEFAGHFTPETLRVLDGALIHALVLLRIDMRILEVRGNRMDRKFRHGDPSLVCEVNSG